MCILTVTRNARITALAVFPNPFFITLLALCLGSSLSSRRLTASALHQLPQGQQRLFSSSVPRRKDTARHGMSSSVPRTQTGQSLHFFLLSSANRPFCTLAVTSHRRQSSRDASAPLAQLPCQALRQEPPACEQAANVKRRPATVTLMGGV